MWPFMITMVKMVVNLSTILVKVGCFHTDGIMFYTNSMCCVPACNMRIVFFYGNGPRSAVFI